MSSCPTPLTRPERPPFRGGPPVRTTFDGSPPGGGEPDYVLHLESAQRLLQAFEKLESAQRSLQASEKLESAQRLLEGFEKIEGTAETRELPQHVLKLQLRLFRQRERRLIEHLWAMRSISAWSMPPIRGFDMSDMFMPESALEMKIVNTLQRLTEAIEKVKSRLDMQNYPFRLSEL